MSKIQFMISTCLRSIICLSSWLLACSAIRMWNCRCWLWTAKRNPSSSPPPAARRSKSASTWPARRCSSRRWTARRPLREEPRRLRLERFAELVQLPHVGARRDLDPRAGARARLDQAVLLEPLQRVADGQDTHAELPREPPPRQRCAGPKLAAKDLVPNCEVGLVGEAHRHVCMRSAGSVANGPCEVKRPPGAAALPSGLLRQPQRHDQHRLENQRRGQDQQPGRVRPGHAAQPSHHRRARRTHRGCRPS